MKQLKPSGSEPKPDLIEAIARRLPEDVRASFYEEMRHCRSLPEHDEMLRILRVIMILTKLTVDVPAQILEERDRFAALLAKSNDALQSSIKSCVAWQSRVDEDLSRLPGEVAKGIQPAAIATRVNESLLQEFAKSTIPDTAGSLAELALDMRATAVAFQSTVEGLVSSYRGAVRDAEEAIDAIHTSVVRAGDSARLAAETWRGIFSEQFRWTIGLLWGLSLITGFILGLLAMHWYLTGSAM